MYEDFQQPQPGVTPIPISALKQEEKDVLAATGLDLGRHEYVASDLLARMENNPLDVNIVNAEAVQSADEDLEGVNPDVAESIKNAAKYNTEFSREQLEQATANYDEDSLDEPDKDESEPATSDSGPAAGSQDYLVESLAKQRNDTLDRYASSITEEDKTAILTEVITGVPFQREFVFASGRIRLVMQTLPNELFNAVVDYAAAKANERIGGMTLDEYRSLQNRVRAAAQINSVTVGDRLVYKQRTGQSVEEILKAVYETGPGRSEVFRGILVEASREINGLLKAVVREMSEENFTAPSYADIG